MMADDNLGSLGRELGAPDPLSEWIRPGGCHCFPVKRTYLGPAGGLQVAPGALLMVATSAPAAGFIGESDRATISSAAH